MSALLDIRQLDAWYGASQALHGVTLQIEPGEVVALVGRNGSGRSTLARAIMGLVRSEGELRFAGHALGGLRTFEIARLGLGYVPEHRDVFPALSVHENLQLGVAPRARERISRFTFDDAYELFPVLRERRRTRAGALSGGEQQMLTLARTLMGNPSLLLLDEPSEGLAPIIVRQMAEAVRHLKAEGLSVLLSEQNLSFAAAVADRACVIEKGRVRWTGTMAELMADESARRAYLAV